MNHKSNPLAMEKGAGVKHFHIGERIAKRLKELGMTKAEFGRRINTSRQNVPLILGKAEVSTNQVWVISECIGINLLEELGCQYADLHGERTGKEDTQIEIHLSVPDNQMSMSIAKLVGLFSDRLAEQDI